MMAFVASRFARGLGYLKNQGFAALLAGLGAASIAGGCHASDIQHVRFGGDDHGTRIVVELSRSAASRLLSSEAHPGHVVLELEGVQAAAISGDGYGLVKAWVVTPGAGAAKLDLELSREVVVSRRFLMTPSGGAGYRFVIDLEPAHAAAKPAAVEPIAMALDVKPSKTVKIRAQKKTVVVDAGHGGKDPGALGAGRREKDATLAAALMLKAKLEATGRYRVVLTRDSDVFIPLDRRVAIARQADGDLFISLHADSGAADARGATVYTLSDSGTERAAKKVMSGRKGGDGDWSMDLPGKDVAVNKILLDLTQRATRNRSAAFADTLVRRLSDRVPLTQKSHRNAGFFVLLAPDVPAVLLEMGFITNREDGAALGDEEARERLTASVVSAIDDYFFSTVKVASFAFSGAAPQP